MKKFLLTLSILIPFVAEAGTLSIGAISPNANVPAGTNITFQITPSTLLNPRYTLTDDSPASTLSNSNITQLGKFDWTPSNTDIGTHNLVITGTDTYGNRDTVNQTLVIATSTPLSIKTFTSTSVLPGKTFSLAVIAQGYSDPSYSVTDSFFGSSISNFNINSSGVFSWEPTQRDVGVHNLGFRVTTPSGRNDVLYQTVTVNGIYLANNSYNVTVGSPLSITLSPYGLTSSASYNPSYRVTDSTRNNTIDNSTFSGNTFNWTPRTEDVGTHIVTISTTDFNGNYISLDLNIKVSPIYTAPVVVNEPVIIAPILKYKFTKSLSVGSTGNEVVELQKLLKNKGFFNGPTNGTFGPLTKAAVKRFQKTHNISQLGNVGPATRAELNK